MFTSSMTGIADGQGIAALRTGMRMREVRNDALAQRADQVC